MAQESEIRYLNAPSIDTKKKKYCRFKKSGIKYIDYKDPEFLKKFLNEQGKILPRRITGTSLKYQRRVAQQQAHKLAALKADAEKKAEAIKDVALCIAAKVSATGQLYGSVGANQVAEELKKLGHEIDRKIITMKDAKTVGDFVALVHFHKEVTVEVPVKVVAENAPVEEKKEEAAPAVEAPVAEAPAQEEAAAEE